MPMYEFTCNSCKKNFEMLRGYTERDDECECPHCKTIDKMTRLSSLVNTGSSSGSQNTAGSCGPPGFT